MIRAPDKNKKPRPGPRPTPIPPSPKPTPSPKPIPKERNLPDAPGTGLFIIQKNGSYYHDTGGIAGGRFLTKDEYNRLIALDPNISNLTVTEDQYKKGDYKLPPRTKPFPLPPRDRPEIPLGGPRGPADEPLPPRTTPPPRDFPPYDRSIPTGEVPIPQQGTPQIPPGGGFVPPATTIDELISRQTYQNLLQQQMANAAAQGKPIGMQPQQPAQPVRTSQQAMQNYQNLVGQGIANMQAMGRITPPGQLPSQPQRKTSTQSFQTPRPFG